MIEDGTPSESGATGNIDGINAEALMGQIESTGQVQPQAAPDAGQAQPLADPSKPQAAPVDPAAQAAQAQPTPAAPWEKDKIKVGGQEFEASRAQILQWAAQGRNYPQLVEKLNAEKAQLDSKYKVYAEIDAYAKANPDWLETVQAAYQQKISNAPATSQVPPELKAEIDQLKEFKSNFENEQSQKALDADVQDIRKAYPDLSWDVLDESGSSLEMRVYDHAVKNGIQSFKTAFRDLMHDHIVKYQSDKAREQAVKELQAQRKQGLVGVSTSSQYQATQAPQTFKNYDDAAAAALAAHGIQAS